MEAFRRVGSGEKVQYKSAMFLWILDWTGSIARADLLSKKAQRKLRTRKGSPLYQLVRPHPRSTVQS